jgi:hypothetical protein
MPHHLGPEIVGAQLASEVLGFGAGVALSALLLCCDGAQANNPTPAPTSELDIIRPPPR